MTFASLCFFAATFIASARLTFTVSKDFISFSVANTSGSGARCAKADVAAHKMKSKKLVVWRIESLLPYSGSRGARSWAKYRRVRRLCIVQPPPGSIAYGQIITTRTLQDRIDTLGHAREAGLK